MPTINYRGKQLVIEQDEDAQSPSEYGDNGLFLVSCHRDFYVPAPGEKNISRNADEIMEPYKKTHWIFPAEAYIHSGVRLALSGQGNFPDRRWDVSQCVLVFVSKKEWRLSKSARKAAQSKIDEWNQYLSGDVYGYTVGEDSCWGFYGYDYCVEQAKEAADFQIASELKARLAKVRAFILNKVPLAIREKELA